MMAPTGRWSDRIAFEASDDGRLAMLFVIVCSKVGRRDMSRIDWSGAEPTAEKLREAEKKLAHHH